MKKFLFSLFIMLCACNVNLSANETKDGVGFYSDVKAATATLYQDSKDFLKSSYPEVKEAVVSIASGIGVAAEYVFTVLTKKFVVEGVSELLIFIFGMFLCIYAFVKINKIQVIFSEMTFKHCLLFIYLIIGIIVLCNVNYNKMLMGLINPEFGAIQYILEYSKSMIN